ncbi:NIF3-like protein 1 [Rana temporaria]|uniref:NIF3-like protein 1 n=1 Tax=Rana temporaria TaxID=8407 RepID=UPI001AAD2A90|nr:NIF3-like protein 1 [Rana temporaria]XP_040211835.1 NIF3-like protein 1 [Rana temporaria]
MLGSRWIRHLLPSPSSHLRSPVRHLMDLRSVVSHLKALAPLALAESWDNVGLLVEPSPPHQVQKLLLTNDLTEEVLEEAVGMGANMVLSYHPPIFKALKRLTSGHWKERLVVKALENRLAVYSPHTACDALSNGVNDWLGRALGPCVSVPIRACTSLSHPGGYEHILTFDCDAPATVLPRLQSLRDARVRTYPLMNKDRFHLSCSRDALLQALAILSEKPGLRDSMEIVALQKPPLLDTGMGRLCTLSEPVSISAAVERVKRHLGLAHLRLALGSGKTLESSVNVMAVCAGSGSSILSGVPADLYLTGEMSHHEVLDAVAEGHSVILCEHSNSERGYLQELRGQIAERLEGKVEVVVSKKDHDPLLVV